MQLTVDRARLRRILSAGDAAMAATANASERVRECRLALRDARDELHRQRGWEGQPPHARASAAVELAEQALREAEAEHTRLAEEARPASQLARRVSDYCDERAIRI